jgi:hypothetical protein
MRAGRAGIANRVRGPPRTPAVTVRGTRARRRRPGRRAPIDRLFEELWATRAAIAAGSRTKGSRSLRRERHSSHRRGCGEPPRRHCVLGRRSSRSGSLGDHSARVHIGSAGWVPVPARSDRGRGALVSALRPVLPRRGGAAGRARDHRLSRDDLPVGAGPVWRGHRDVATAPRGALSFRRG